MAARKRTAAELIAKYGVARQRGPRCSIGLSPRRALIDELVAGGMGASHVVFTLRQEFGEKVNDSTMRRHIQGACACPEK